MFCGEACHCEALRDTKQSNLECFVARLVLLLLIVPLLIVARLILALLILALRDCVVPRNDKLGILSVLWRSLSLRGVARHEAKQSRAFCGAAHFAVAHCAVERLRRASQ